MSYVRLNEKVTTQDGWTVKEFVDGTVEISKRFEKSINASDWRTWGTSNTYYANVTNSVAYPFTFADYPSVRSEICRTTGGDLLGTMHENVGSSLSSSPKVSVTRPAQGGAMTVVVELFATGKRASA